MSERLTFGYGTSRPTDGTRRRGSAPEPTLPVNAPQPQKAGPGAAERSRRSVIYPEVRPDAAFIGLMIFTALLFFRPQDQIRGLNYLHLAELSAIGALVAMVAGRTGRGLTVSRVTPELCGVVLMGAIILFMAPFSVWPGGSIGDVHGGVFQDHPDLHPDREYADVAPAAGAIRLVDRDRVRVHRAPHCHRRRTRSQPGRAWTGPGRRRWHVQEPQRSRVEHGRGHSPGGIAGAAFGHDHSTPRRVSVHTADGRCDHRLAVTERHDRASRDGADPRRATGSPDSGGRVRRCARPGARASARAERVLAPAVEHHGPEPGRYRIQGGQADTAA